MTLGPPPPPRDEGVRARMRAQRTTGTVPELALRRALRALGLTGYRVDHPLPIPGRRSDVAYTRWRVVVFVDGCFWHGCPEHGGQHEASAWWREKIARNRRRDRDTDRRLADAGWRVVRAWEHVAPDAAARAVALTLRLAGRPS